MDYYFNVELYIFLKFIKNWYDAIVYIAINCKFVLSDVELNNFIYTYIHIQCS